MRTAAEFAKLLNVELLGLFLEDMRLQELAAIPFLREFKLLGGGWRPIDAGQLARDIELAARNAQRLFANAASDFSMKWRFEVIRGLSSETIGSIFRTGDILMAVQPANPAEHATWQFSWLIDAAFRSAAAVLIVPPRPGTANGSIVAVAAAPGDPSIQTAAAIASAAKEELVAVKAYTGDAGDAAIRELAAKLNLKAMSIAAGKSVLSNPAWLSSLLRHLNGRLLVLTGSAATYEALMEASFSGRIPMLVLGARDASPGPGSSG